MKSSSRYPIKAIIFDFDNTLEDWTPVETEAEVHVAQYVEKQGISARQFLSAHAAVKQEPQTGKPVDFSRKARFAAVFARLNLPPNPSPARLERMYWEYINTHATLFPHVLETLTLLAKHYQLALFSNSDGKKTFKIERIQRLGIAPYFAVILTSDDVDENKPGTKGYERILSELHLTPQDVLVVGDMPPFDLLPAKKLGMTTVWTQQALRSDVQYPYVDYVVRSLRELPELLKQQR